MRVKQLHLPQFQKMLQQVEQTWGEGHIQSKIASELLEDAKKLAPVAGAESREFAWEHYSTFWPPRVLEAFQKRRLACFFGAGLSIPSGLASWSELLHNYFGISSAYSEEKELQTDPLTLAEIAAHQLGAEQLQAVLRSSIQRIEKPSVTHVVAAALRLPLYVTTNYDALFERCWAVMNREQVKLHIITNSADLATHMPSGAVTGGPA